MCPQDSFSCKDNPDIKARRLILSFYKLGNLQVIRLEPNGRLFWLKYIVVWKILRKKHSKNDLIKLLFSTCIRSLYIQHNRSKTPELYKKLGSMHVGFARMRSHSSTKKVPLAKR